jgi:hypothetical protein
MNAVINKLAGLNRLSSTLPFLIIGSPTPLQINNEKKPTQIPFNLKVPHNIIKMENTIKVVGSEVF